MPVNRSLQQIARDLELSRRIIVHIKLWEMVLGSKEKITWFDMLNSNSERNLSHTVFKVNWWCKKKLMYIKDLMNHMKEQKHVKIVSEESFKNLLTIFIVFQYISFHLPETKYIEFELMYISVRHYDVCLPSAPNCPHRCKVLDRELLLLLSHTVQYFLWTTS